MALPSSTFVKRFLTAPRKLKGPERNSGTLCLQSHRLLSGYIKRCAHAAFSGSAERSMRQYPVVRGVCETRPCSSGPVQLLRMTQRARARVLDPIRALACADASS